MNFKKFHVSRNLFDKSAAELTGYTLSGTTFTPTAGTCHIDYELPSGTYTISCDNDKTIFIRNGKVDSGYISQKTSEQASTTFTYDASVDGYLRISSFGATVSNIMLNTGSQPLPYEPYSSEVWHDTPHYIHNTSTDTITTLPADIYANDTTATVGLQGNMEQSSQPSPTTPIQPQSCGERTGNLFDKSTAVWGAYIQEDGTVITEGTSKTTWLSDFIPVTAGASYTLNQTGSRRGKFYKADKTPYQTTDMDFSGLTDKNTFAIPETVAYIRFNIYAVVANLDIIMLNSGSTPLPYEPYGYKIPILNNSQTTNVYLGEVETTRNIKKLVLDGTEGWTASQSDDKRFFFITLAESDYIILDGGIVCSHFAQAVISSNNTNIGIGQGGTSQIRIRPENSGSQSGSNFAVWLAQQYSAGTPVCVWYVLATPQTAVVNEPLRKIGDYADTVSDITIPTIAGANTLSIDTTLQPSEVTVNYKGWHKASEIVHRYQYGEWDGSPVPTYPVYGFKIDKNNVDPDTRVTYLYDAEGMTPAYMDFNNGTFNYGSWANAWFIKNNRPVALKFDGTVDYELNHTDFTKKLDGTASDVEDVNYAGNFMSEMPTVYVKRWEDNDYNYMAFCEIPYDEDFLAQAHTNANGTVNSAIYLPMFKGSVDSNNKIRSLMGTYPTGNTSTIQEAEYSANCGTGWQIWDKAKIDLIMDLIILITKSTNCRAKIGNGDAQTYNASDTTNYGKMKSGYETDSTTRSTNAQFWGYEGSEVTNYGEHHMIAFYIEDLWGNRWDRCLGFNIVDGFYKVKMVTPYALDGDSSYETLTVMPPISTEGWLKNISSANAYGDVPMELGASSTSGFANYFLKNSSSSVKCIALFGGYCTNGVRTGRYWNIYNYYNNAAWFMGCSPCFNKPS